MNAMEMVAQAAPAAFKYSTPIPPSVTTPERVETRALGTLSFFDGFPEKDLVVNPDTSVDVYFGPRPPDGKEVNWVQTVPGKGFYVTLRLYGPLEPWFEKTWRPGEIERL